MKSSFFMEIDSFQKKKYNQNAYGDTFVSERFHDEGRLVAVLSDGLSSGIKAGILSQMTACMFLKFISAGRNLQKASETIMNSLPVCRVRKISYATFSAIDCDETGFAKIVEEGNPQFLWIRNNEFLDIEPLKVITSKKFTTRKLNIYEIKLEPEDRLVFCSDGVTQAGLGSMKLKLGLRRQGLIEYLRKELALEPNISSRDLSRKIVDMAEDNECDKLAKDDISAAVLYLRKPRMLMVFTGPPYYADRDQEYAKVLSEYSGKKVVCGGTTANLVARELGVDIETDVLCRHNLPATSKMQGIDLVTEGVLTLTRVEEYLEYPERVKKDPAGMLVEILLNSDCIDFMVGAKLNQAHYDPDLPVELEIRKNIIKKIINLLEKKYIKKVSLRFM